MFDQPRRLHPAAILIGAGAVIRQALLPLVFTVFAGVQSREAFFVLIILAVGAGVAILSLLGPFLGYLRTTYVIRDDALVVNTGWLWTRTRVIPLHRIHNVNFKQNLIHRLLRSTSVEIETAAGAGVEARLEAVGVLDAYDLRAVLLRQTDAPSEPSAVAAEPPPLYQITNRQLFIAGALTNRLLYIIAAVAGVFQFEELAKDVARPVVAWISRLDPLTGALYSSLLFFALILVGWVLSVVYSFTRFYGFRIEKHPGGLLLKYGLLTRVQTVIATGRVQALRFIQPLLFRPFGYCEVYADTAGSFDSKELGGASKLCPITPIDGIDEMAGIALPGATFSGFEWKRASPRSVPRRIVAGIVGSTFFYGSLAAVLALGSFDDRLPWLRFVPLLWAPAIVWTILASKLRYRVEGYGEQPGYLASRVGFWRRSVAMAPIDRAQWVEAHQSLFQRRWRLADLTIATAAGDASRITIPDLDVEDAYALKEKIVAELRARSARRAGGL